MVNNKEEQLRILGERGEEIRQGESELEKEKSVLSKLEFEKHNLRFEITHERNKNLDKTTKLMQEEIYDKSHEEIRQKIKEDLGEEIEKIEREKREKLLKTLTKTKTKI